MKGNRLPLDSESGKIKCRLLRKRTGAFFKVIYFWKKKNVIIIIKITISLSFLTVKKQDYYSKQKLKFLLLEINVK